MATQQEFHLGELETWVNGPPHDEFKRMRAQCPVNWTEKIEEYPTEAGYWSVTTADDVHTVSRDWETFSSAFGITALTDSVMPLELIQAMFIGMDPPKHDRLKSLFQRGFTPKRIAEQPRRLAAMAMIGIAELQGPLRHSVEAGEQGLRLEFEVCQAVFDPRLQRFDIGRSVMIRRKRPNRGLPAHPAQMGEGFVVRGGRRGRGDRPCPIRGGPQRQLARGGAGAPSRPG